jgi:hypothetical protein
LQLSQSQQISQSFLNVEMGTIERRHSENLLVIDPKANVA